MNEENPRNETAVDKASGRREEQHPVLNYAAGLSSRNDAAFLSFCMGMGAWLWLILGFLLAGFIGAQREFAVVLFVGHAALAIGAVLAGDVGMLRTRICGTQERHFALAGLWLGSTALGLLVLIVGSMLS